MTPMGSSNARRGIPINLRVDRSKRALIDPAAKALEKNRSEFILDAPAGKQPLFCSTSACF